MKQTFYSLQNDQYAEDANGGVAGVTWIADGIEYLVVHTDFITFNPEQRISEALFKKFAKVGNQWAVLPAYTKVIDDSKYMYGVPTHPEFGSYEDNPELGSNGKPTDPNLVTEAQFFIDNIIQNKFGIPISLAQFSWATIKRNEGL